MELNPSTGQSKSKQKLFFGLFVFPLLIAVGMAVLLCTIVLLTNEEETPESLITAIKTGTPSKKWQKAFELSNELNRKNPPIRSIGVLKEAAHILGDKEHYDSKTRAYIAMALSRFKDPEAEAALQKALTEVNEKKEDVMLPIFLMWAIGSYENPESADAVSRFLASEDPALRKTAAYVLGVLENPSVISQLMRSLEDSEVDVKWNAALSLARLGSDAGSNVIIQMLDRNYLQQAHQLKEDRIENVMTNAAKGLALLQRSDTHAILENISKNDPSVKVRQAALSILESGKNTSNSLDQKQDYLTGQVSL